MKFTNVFLICDLQSNKGKELENVITGRLSIKLLTLSEMYHIIPFHTQTIAMEIMNMQEMVQEFR